jgi:hypothetical protein
MGWLQEKCYIPSEILPQHVRVYCMGIDTEPVEDEEILQQGALSHSASPLPPASELDDVSAEVDWLHLTFLSSGSRR